MKTPYSIDRAFYNKIRKIGSCWVFEGAKSGKGYGALSWQGKFLYAHRFSYELFKGKITDGLWVLHRCDNPPCVNPDHLFLGTNKDNLRDAIKKGIFNPHHTKNRPRGESHYRSKLDLEEVQEIRKRYVKGGSVELAKEFGVNRHTIYRIAKNQIWNPSS